MIKVPAPVPAVALVASLIDDPFYQAITMDFAQDARARLQALTDYFVLSLEEADRTGRYVTLDGASELGAAAWLLPREPDIEASESAAKAAALIQILGPRGHENYHRIVDFMTPRAEQVIAADAWYLSIVGVAPSAQGRGLGARLIAPTLAEADAAGATCYLETFTPRNRSFYERLGFRRVATHVEPTTQSPYIVMQRDARRAWP